MGDAPWVSLGWLAVGVWVGRAVCAACWAARDAREAERDYWGRCGDEDDEDDWWKRGEKAPA